MDKSLPIVDVLDNFGIGPIGDRQSIFERLEPMDREKVCQLLMGLAEALPEPKKAGSSYRYIGNLTASGFPFPCESYSCRSRAFFETVSFAALYSDEYILFNPFSHHRLYRIFDDVKLKKEAAFLIVIILSVASLIERGIITFVDAESYNICYSCFGKGLIKSARVKTISDASDEYDLMMELGNQIVGASTVIYEGLRNGKMVFSLENVESVFGHSNINFRADASMKVHGKLEEGKQLTKTQIRRMGFFRFPTEYMLNDLISVNQNAHDYGVSNISASEAQLNALSTGFSAAKLSSELNIEYPFLNLLEVNNLMTFRDNEWHHLIQYRDFIQSILNENPDANIQDEINSELSKIGNVIEKNTKSSRREFSKEVGIFAMNAGVAYFSAGLSNLIAGAVAALSGGHFAKNTVPLIIDRFTEPDAVRESKIYYTWKARKKFSVE